MRTTKTVLCAAALAAGVVSSMAQNNVYSLNVVGYVNKVFPANKMVCVVAPLDAGTNNLTTLIPTAPLGSTVQTWNVSKQAFDSTVSSYSTRNKVWQPDLVIPPGKAFIVTMGADYTNTFVGNVPQGALTNTITGNGSMDLIGSMVPVSGSLTTNIMPGFIGQLGDTVQTWNVNNQAWDATVASYSTRNKMFQPDPSINVGDGFMFTRTATGTNFVVNFTVQ